MSKDITPMVSVRIPSYNHEKYINECIDSVLAQTYQDFEIIITDDGSTDNTVKLIKEYKDPRIKLNVFSENQGTAVAVSDCVDRSRGKYIANLCSDDAWVPDKLEKQVSFLQNNPGYDAVFTKVKIIDEDSVEVKKYSDFSSEFDKDNRPREDWLNYFFYHGNCLCIPSVLIRRSVYKKLHYQDKRMANLLDFDLWVRFCLEHELYIIDEKLTNFRLRSKSANASGATNETYTRIKFEYKQILGNYLRIHDTKFFARCFPEYKKYLSNNQISEKLIPYLLGRLACDTNRDFQQLWGLETIFNLINDEETAKMLAMRCNFRYLDLHKLSGQLDVFHSKRMWRKIALLKPIGRLTQAILRRHK